MKCVAIIGFYRGNLADLNSKESTQETLSSLMGMVGGIFLARQLQKFDESNSYWITWVIFIILTFLHIWSNYRGVQVLVLKTLNLERYKCAVDELLDVCENNYVSENDNLRLGFLSDNAMLDTIKFIAQPENISESIFRSMHSLLFSGRIRAGVSFYEFSQNITSKILSDLMMQQFHSERYLLNIYKCNGMHNYCIKVVLRSDSNLDDMLKSLFHALLIERLISNKKNRSHRFIPEYQEIVKLTHKLLVQSLYSEKGNNVCLLDHLSNAGWDCSRLYLGFGPWRYELVEKED